MKKKKMMKKMKKEEEEKCGELSANEDKEVEGEEEVRRRRN